MTLAIVGLATLDEALEVFARNEPTCLTVDLEALELAGAQIAADRLNAQVQLGCDLGHGQEALSGHYHDVTKHSMTWRGMSPHVAKNLVEYGIVEHESEALL